MAHRMRVWQRALRVREEGQGHEGRYWGKAGCRRVEGLVLDVRDLPEDLQRKKGRPKKEEGGER